MIKFGWCLTGQHEMCTKEFGNTKCECTCESHGLSPDYKEQGKVEE